MSFETCPHCGRKVWTEPDAQELVWYFEDHSPTGRLTGEPCDGSNERAPTNEDRRNDEADRKIKDVKENP